MRENKKILLLNTRNTYMNPTADGIYFRSLLNFKIL